MQTFGRPIPIGGCVHGPRERSGVLGTAIVAVASPAETRDPVPPRYVGSMLLLLLGLVFAAEPDRLEGVHFGVGVGAALYSATTLSDGDVYAYTSVSSYTSLRLRLGQRWAIEPALRLGRTGSSDVEEGDPTTVTEHADAYSVGMRVRSRLATVDQVDLVAAVGAWHTREWWRRVTDNPEDDVEAERETSFQATTSAGSPR